MNLKALCDAGIDKVPKHKGRTKMMPSRNKPDASKAHSLSNTMGTMNSGIMTRETKIWNVEKGDGIPIGATKSIQPGDIRQQATNTARSLRPRQENEIRFETGCQMRRAHALLYCVLILMLGAVRESVETVPGFIMPGLRGTFR